MRWTLAEVIQRREDWSEWWLETPWRNPRNWWIVLTEPGHGWLRWGICDHEWPAHSYCEPPTYGQVAPPLRRAWLPIQNAFTYVIRVGGWVHDDSFGWVRLSWGEMVSWDYDLADPDWPDDYLLPATSRRADA